MFCGGGGVEKEKRRRKKERERAEDSEIGLIKRRDDDALSTPTSSSLPSTPPSGRNPDPGPHHRLRRQVLRLHHEDAAGFAPAQGRGGSREGGAEARTRLELGRQHLIRDGARDRQGKSSGPAPARSLEERGEERGGDGEEHGRESGRGGLKERGRKLVKKNEGKTGVSSFRASLFSTLLAFLQPFGFLSYQLH